MLEQIMIDIRINLSINVISQKVFLILLSKFTLHVAPATGARAIVIMSVFSIPADKTIIIDNNS